MTYSYIFSSLSSYPHFFSSATPPPGLLNATLSPIHTVFNRADVVATSLQTKNSSEIGESRFIELISIGVPLIRCNYDVIIYTRNILRELLARYSPHNYEFCLRAPNHLPDPASSLAARRTIRAYTIAIGTLQRANAVTEVALCSCTHASRFFFLLFIATHG